LSPVPPLGRNRDTGQNERIRKGRWFGGYKKRGTSPLIRLRPV